MTCLLGPTTACRSLTANFLFLRKVTAVKLQKTRLKTPLGLPHGLWPRALSAFQGGGSRGKEGQCHFPLCCLRAAELPQLIPTNTKKVAPRQTRHVATHTFTGRMWPPRRPDPCESGRTSPVDLPLSLSLSVFAEPESPLFRPRRRGGGVTRRTHRWW